jgi:hypothetical protein
MAQISIPFTANAAVNGGFVVDWFCAIQAQKRATEKLSI